MAKKQLKKKIQHSNTFYVAKQEGPKIVQSWYSPKNYVNKNRRDTSREVAEVVRSIVSSRPEVVIPYSGVPVKDKTTHVSYIGGDRDAARKAYWEEAPIIKAATDSIAGRYGINPELLRSRLNKEGFTDSAINLYNGINTNVDADNRNNIRTKVLGYPYLHSEGEHNIGIQRFGLDDGATYINSGLANLINESWNNGEFTNEKGRVTNAANGASILDNMGIMASLIKGFRDQAAKDYPNATPEELDNYANIYYNRGITGGRNYINNGNGSTPYTMAEGGSLQTHKPWNNLSMAEKAEMIGVAVRNGITSLPEIRAKYNEFAEGGRADIIYQDTEPDANLYAGGGYMEKAKAMIRANEGWRSKPYKDAPKGKNWRSVGYGFNDSGFWERYPEGISKHYENGITRAQAEKELDYFLGKAERQLKGIYGKRWNSFNDNQKAAILDTYYQRPASVGSKSGFYGAVMSGKDGAPYLGVQGFGDRNQSRRDLYRGKGVTAPVSFESMAEPVVSEADEVLHFEPLNPQVFGMQLPTYQAPVIDTIDTIDRIDTIDKTYDPAAIEKQERQDNLRRFGMFMSMLDGTSGQDSGMPDFIDMLAGKPMTYGNGGHLYDGGGYVREKDNNPVAFDEEGNLVDQVTGEKGYVLLPELSVTANPDDVARGRAQRWYRDFGIESNDATSVADGRRQNSHLDERGIEGAAKAAAWAKDHPVLNNVGLGLSAIPLTVAATPAVVGGGEFAATALANPYVDAALTSYFGAHGLNHAINEGINGWGDAAMTALEITPLGRLFKPAFEMGYSAAKPIFNKAATSLQNNYPALFDPYTSWDATLGYHGDNIFSRAIGTIGRRYGYTPKAGVPEFHRRLTINRPSQLKLDEEGNMIISSGRTGEGHDGIVNFATSEPARGHSSHKSLSGIDDYIIDSKAIGNQDFKSIQPSDTFFETGQLAIDPKSMTLVSGNTEMLDYAKSLGMRTLSSPRLRQLTASRMTKEDVINSRSEGIAKFLQNVGEIKYGKGQQNAGQIGEEMQRLTSMRGTPTMQDYSYFESLTGLNSGVRPAEMWNGTKEQGLELFGNWGKPRRTPTFNHVAYAPASSIESIYREAKMGTRPWEDYYAALENMPSARQQLGLNSAMDTYLGEPVIPEGYVTVKPQVRTRVGDVEVDNPLLTYRQGDASMGADFLNTGVVSMKNGSYENPMFAQGKLFYGSPSEAPTLLDPSLGATKGSRSGRVFLLRKPKDMTAKSDLLVSDIDMANANKDSRIVSPYIRVQDEGGNTIVTKVNEDIRRVPFAEEPATSENTTLYRWKPNYGYKKIENPESTYVVGKEIVDDAGNLNINVDDLLEQIKTEYPYTLNPEDLINKGINGSTDLSEHIQAVVQSAQTYPLPEGVSRKEFVTAALYHDLGKVFGDFGHGTNSAVIASELNLPITRNAIKAISQHMNQQEYFETASQLEKALHAADVGRGMKYEALVEKYPYLKYDTPQITTENASSITP